MLLHSPLHASHRLLQRTKSYGDTGIVFWQLRGVHPVPEFYKHYSYIFTEAATAEGEAFIATANRHCEYTMRKRHEALKAAGEVAIGLTERLPRRGPDTPFDPKHPRWADAEWAPPLGEDPDPEVPGGFR